MTRIIGIANQKGGVGKTTTAVNLASCLAASNRRTLLIDMDPQANATSGVGLKKDQVSLSIYDVLLDSIPIADALYKTPIQSLDIIPSKTALFGAGIELLDFPDKERRLSNAIQPIRGRFDYIIIDSPPALDFLTINVLVAARELIIPVQCEYYALEGLTQLLDTIHRVQSNLNPSLQVLGVLMTMHDSRTNLAKQVVDEVRKHFGDRVFNTIIGRSVRLSEAPGYGLPIILYDLRSSGATSYIRFCQEVTDACETQSAGQGA